MPAFEYEALDGAGKPMRGLLTADSEVAARRILRQRRLAPLRLSRADRAGARSASFSFGSFLGAPRLAASELMSVTRQLATLIGAGMPVEEAVGMIASQAEPRSVRRVLMTVQGRITEGEHLSDAMAEHPESFPAVYRAMIAAGESSGGLSLVLERLADYLEKSEALKRRIGVAMVYPCVLGALALLVVCILMIFIVPRIAEQFASLDVTLPLITRFMIGASQFLTAFWPLILVGVAVTALALGLVMRSLAMKQFLDAWVLHLPGLGRFIRKIESARFARTMAILVASGTVLPDALRAASKASGNTAFQAMLRTALTEVEQGIGLSDALRAGSWFPQLMVYMIASGERSGRLDDMFARAADHLDAELDSAVSVALSLMEPGIIIVMGGIVAAIVLSILLPILRLNTLAMG